MTDFVVYHNQDTEGGPPGTLGPAARSDRNFSIGTAKPNPEQLLDHSRVWVVSGRGAPKKWALHYWFIPSGFGPSPRGSARPTSVYGKQGASAPSRQGVPLDKFEWFKRLYVDRKLFSFGLQSLASKEGLLLASEFEKLAKNWPARGAANRAPAGSSVLPRAAADKGRDQKVMQTLTMNIKGSFFAAIVARTKDIEYRRRSPFWQRRIEPLTPPFKLRLLNGMTPPVPEAVVMVTRVTTDPAGHEYRLHLGKVLNVRHWSRQAERPRR